VHGQGLLRPLRRARKARLDDVYLLRVEQLYPFPAMALITELGRFKQRRFRLVPGGAEEHGRWTFIEPNIEWVLDHIGAKHKTRPRYAGRPAAAATATGLMSKHLLKPGNRAIGCDRPHGDRKWRVKSAFRPLGESVTEATVASWYKKSGDAVNQPMNRWWNWKQTR
jgi:hypothetical protein